MTEFFSNITWMVFQNFLLKMVDTALNTFVEPMIKTMTTTNSLLTEPVLINVIGYIQGIAITLVSVVIGFEALNNWILFQNGDSQANPKDVLLKLAKTVAIITCVPWIVHQVYYWGTELATDISNISNVQYVGSNSVNGVMLSMLSIANISNPIILCFLVIIGIVLLILIFIQTFVRAAELAVIAVSGPIMALGILKSSSGLFQTWWKELVCISLAQAMQILLIKLAFASLFVYETTDDPFFCLIKFLAYLWVCYKSPAVLKQFAYSSGVGHAVGGTAQSAGSMYMIQRMITKI